MQGFGIQNLASRLASGPLPACWSGVRDYHHQPVGGCGHLGVCVSACVPGYMRVRLYMLQVRAAAAAATQHTSIDVQRGQEEDQSDDDRYESSCVPSPTKMNYHGCTSSTTTSYEWTGTATTQSADRAGFCPTAKQTTDGRRHQPTTQPTTIMDHWRRNTHHHHQGEE